ncbi:MAG: hypothetical protein HKN72_14955 [Gemmatimonadetes bacterium]|nr:PTS system mannose/fructose/sorbose family transporter subunit IID [Gemmatimonadota bacterium]NNF14526.1 hypothetical protein [Gemmatimonadota bacterium]
MKRQEDVGARRQGDGPSSAEMAGVDAVGVEPEARGISSGTRLSVFARTLLVQASWNYRTMLGSGVAYALIPALRALTDDDDALDESINRHLEHFNAHPYLAGIAVGAVVRLEAEGADPTTVRKLKLALRGPLGSLGDALVWATVLPGTAMMALTAFWLGAPPLVAALLFLLAFNVVHLWLRAWGFRAGLTAGRDVGRALSKADLSGWTRRLEPVVVAVLGVLCGAVVGSDDGLFGVNPAWTVLAAGAFVVGLLGGHRTWRPAAALTVAAIGVAAIVGVAS